jgi:hypothetical protein
LVLQIQEAPLAVSPPPPPPPGEGQSERKSERKFAKLCQAQLDELFDKAVLYELSQEELPSQEEYNTKMAELVNQREVAVAPAAAARAGWRRRRACPDGRLRRQVEQGGSGDCRIHAEGVCCGGTDECERWNGG